MEFFIIYHLFLLANDNFIPFTLFKAFDAPRWYCSFRPDVCHHSQFIVFRAYRDESIYYYQFIIGS